MLIHERDLPIQVGGHEPRIYGDGRDRCLCARHGEELIRNEIMTADDAMRMLYRI